VSLFLYRLGHGIGHRRVVVIVVWLVLLVAALAGARTLGTHYDNTFSIPGTDSQQGQDVLASRFPTASGASGQIVFTTTRGGADVTTAKTEIKHVLDRVGDLDAVSSVTDPFADGQSGSVSKDGEAVLVTVQFDTKTPTTEQQDAVQAAVATADGGVEAVYSPSGLGTTSDGSKLPELIGVLIALLVLVITFGSFLTAGMPLVSALIGVGITTGSIVVVSSLGDVSSTAPTLAEMLGLAVGIDYALFLLSRYRAELGGGARPREAMARALGTAGSAVVFAGLTVVIALLGLSVANIPFLTVMGVAGAAAVALAVLVALTFVPAVALLFGSRLCPRPRKAPTGSVSRSERITTAWVRFVTKVPAVTVAVVVLGLGVCAFPMTQLSLALPDNGSQPAGSAQREAYDRIADHFGPGYNAPLIITADVLASDKPSDAVSELSKRIGAMHGVAAVTQATPNEQGDTALLRVVPTTAQNDEATADLVHRIRDEAPTLEKASGAADVLVTGTTASDIDVSERLASALLPFASVVVGLSLILLLLVFRSVAIPIKATLGYLLSVGASLGAVTAVFQWGWFNESVAGGAVSGPVLSFLPIIVMGVLFGLAMDYEMFLVSRMREHHAHHGDAQAAIRGGFTQSAPVVTAAAVIMLSVFVAFIPDGTSTIKPIAFGLAVGVFVDAFLVRLTLVPAILSLLGRAAWWIPRWLDRIVPVVDVEGEAIAKRIAADRETADGAVLVARDLVVSEGATPLTAVVFRDGATTVRFGDARTARTAAFVLAGRLAPEAGTLVVAGHVVPEESGRVLADVGLVDLAADPGSGTVEDRARTAASVRLRRAERARIRDAVLHRVRAGTAIGATPIASIDPGTAVADLDAAQRLIVEGAVHAAFGRTVLIITGPSRTVRTPGPVLDSIAMAADALGRLGATVVLVVPEPVLTTPEPRTDVRA